MSEEQQPSKKPRLAAAAEALIEAASLETDTMTQKRLTASLDSLKSSFDDNLNRAVQTVKSSNENFDTKINTLSQHMADVKKEIGALKVIMEREEKQKTLERALKLTHINSFNYYDPNIGTKNSSDLAKSVIERFPVGFGYNLPAAQMSNVYGYAEKQAASKKEFSEKFKKQIKDLIGREPRLVKEENGTYSIFYE